jgi:hypothetical protein
MFLRFRCSFPLLILFTLLASCGTAPVPVSPTDTPSPAPTTEPIATKSSMLQAGLNYPDAAGDMEISFLDVTGFQATVNEEAEILEVVLHMRDIPPTVTRGDVGEYMWDIAIFLDPSTIDAANHLPDYGFMVLTANEEIQTPGPHTSDVIPITQLWDRRIIYNAVGENLSPLEAVADPDANSLTLTGRIPGITSGAVFSFGTVSDDGKIDRPDSYVPPESANRSTPLPENTQTPPTVQEETAQLIPTGAVRAYPGPDHYVGDVLTFEIITDGNFEELVAVSMTLDDRTPVEISVTPAFINLALPLALDTTYLSIGRHTVKFTASDGHLNETYSFDLLPADQRPANETQASWQVNETACCTLHYISDTAAARDIEFIAEHFQQAARDFSKITGKTIDPKLDVYLIDTMWGNGGFGGNGELVISYTDRYYGPTTDGTGLETLARHEFTHAAGIEPIVTGDGLEFNYEGLALYVAGGHYKPEPLAERGAALFDLGYYVPVGQYSGQHELDYLYAAAMLTYIVETYGTEEMWNLLAYDDNPGDGQLGSFEAALQASFGISLEEFDQSFRAWLESKDPGPQLDDLQLTIELQDLRREYQETYAPPPSFILAEAADAAARREYLPVVMREARAPANIATELIIAHGQQAIVDGDYSRAEELNKLLADILSTGEFQDPLAKDYLEVVLAAAAAGYEVVELEFQGDRANAKVTNEPPSLIDLVLQKVDGIWQVQR